MSCTTCQRVRLQRIIYALKAVELDGVEGNWITAHGSPVFIPKGADISSTIKKHFDSIKKTSEKKSPEKQPAKKDKSLKTATRLSDKDQKTIETHLKSLEPMDFDNLVRMTSKQRRQKSVFMLEDGSFIDSGYHKHADLFKKIKSSQLKKLNNLDTVMKNVGKILPPHSNDETNQFAGAIGMLRLRIESHGEIAIAAPVKPSTAQLATIKELILTINSPGSKIETLYDDGDDEGRINRYMNKYTLNAADKNKGGSDEKGNWITVKGSAVFIPDGVDKGRAIKDHFGDKKETELNTDKQNRVWDDRRTMQLSNFLISAGLTNSLHKLKNFKSIIDPILSYDYLDNPVKGLKKIWNRR